MRPCLNGFECPLWARKHTEPPLCLVTTYQYMNDGTRLAARGILLVWLTGWAFEWFCHLSVCHNDDYRSWGVISGYCNLYYINKTLGNRPVYDKSALTRVCFTTNITGNLDMNIEVLKVTKVPNKIFTPLNFTDHHNWQLHLQCHSLCE